MKSSPARLDKIEEKSVMVTIEDILQRHSQILLIICLLLLLFLIIALAITIIDISGISMVESGTYYNHIQDVI